jgi:hypothetical protein
VADVVVHSYNPGTQVAEARGYRGQDQPRQLSETISKENFKKGWGCSWWSTCTSPWVSSQHCFKKGDQRKEQNEVLGGGGDTIGEVLNWPVVITFLLDIPKLLCLCVPGSVQGLYFVSLMPHNAPLSMVLWFILALQPKKLRHTKDSLSKARWQ